MARKAVLKRIRITKTGKLLRRGAGQNHFNAKMSRRQQQRRNRWRGLDSRFAKNIKRYLG